MRQYVIPALLEVQLHPAVGGGGATVIDKFEAHANAGTVFGAVAGSIAANRNAANDILLRMGVLNNAERLELFAYARHWLDERLF